MAAIEMQLFGVFLFYVCNPSFGYGRYVLQLSLRLFLFIFVDLMVVVVIR